MLILEYGLVSILILAGVVGLASMLEGEYERLGRANPLKWAGDAFKWISQRPWFFYWCSGRSQSLCSSQCAWSLP